MNGTKNCTCHDENHHPVLLRSRQPHGAERDHAGQPRPLHEPLQDSDDHDGRDLIIGSHDGQGEVEDRAEEGATPEHPFAAEGAILK